MKYIEPLPFELTDSNIPDDYIIISVLWDENANYNKGDEVFIVVHSYKPLTIGWLRSTTQVTNYYIYQALKDNNNIYPKDNPDTWQRISISHDKPDTPSEFGYYKWTDGDWATGAIVAVVDAFNGNLPTYGIYKAIADATTGEWPPATPTKWQYLGVVHKYRPFDSAINTVAQMPDEISYTLAFNIAVSSIAFFGVFARSVHILQKDDIGTVIFDKTYKLEHVFSDWWGYFFDPLEYSNSLYVSDLPMYRSSTIEITIENPANIAAVGAIVAGRIVNTGITLFNSGVTSLDLSERVENSGFATLEDRGFLRSTSLLAVVDNRALSSTMTRLLSLRNRLIAFIGDESDKGYELLRSYGFLRRTSALITNPTKTTISLEIEETL